MMKLLKPALRKSKLTSIPLPLGGQAVPGRIVRGALLGGLVGGLPYQALRIHIIANALSSAVHRHAATRGA